VNDKIIIMEGHIDIIDGDAITIDIYAGICSISVNMDFASPSQGLLVIPSYGIMCVRLHYFTLATTMPLQTGF
jgi:hypothetical protein